MDCAACGKPLSVTAKFCGKCGAPALRTPAAQEPEQSLQMTMEEIAVEKEISPPTTSQTSDQTAPTGGKPAPAVSSPATKPTVTVRAQPTTSKVVDDLVVTLSPPQKTPDDNNLLKIDLNLDPAPKKVTKPTVTIVTEPQKTAVSDTEWLQRQEKYQNELKKTLEKHSLLLDFISLASQQQSHLQTQPDPNEPLLHNLIEQQNQIALQLAGLQIHLEQQAQAETSGRVPDELKLLLEKQKIELQKSFAQNVAQNSENLASAHEAELTKVQEMLKANTVAAEGIEKNLAPLIQSVNDLKTKLQALVKKVDEQATAKPKAGGKDDAASEGGGFMVFVIGMLCGLTVVLSSLAIYNFLSHDSSASDSGAKGHDKAATESPSKGHEKTPAESSTKGQDKDAHESSAHSKPAH